MIYIVGNKGNMGRRYTAILHYLGQEVCGHDAEEIVDQGLLKAASGFIICTPTEHHLFSIKRLFEFGRPILCEKPLTKDISKLDELEDKHRTNLSLLTVVNQYAYMRRGTQGETKYDYFKSGSDGLAWDCVSLFQLAKGTITVNNISPFWDVKINGRILNLGLMDWAYIDMIRDWLAEPKSNYAESRKAHEKVLSYIKENE
jgi:hypothetical protein